MDQVYLMTIMIIAYSEKTITASLEIRKQPYKNI